MGFSAIARRCISRTSTRSVGILRIHVDGAADEHGYVNSSYCRELGAKTRMMSSVCVREPPSAPLLMLPAAVDGWSNIVYTFQPLAENGDPIIRKNKICGGGPDELRLLPDLIKDVKFVGSSHGWLALQNRRTYDVFLSNPMTERHIKLPPLSQPLERLVLSSAPSPYAKEEEEEKSNCRAFKSDTCGKLAFCLPGRSNEWTVFGSHYAYDSLVYSSRHNRLFCVSVEPTILEGWDVGGVEKQQIPRLDWKFQNLMFTNWPASSADWPGRQDLKQQCCQLKYVVCAEHTGELFLVVRHVNHIAGPSGSFAAKMVFSRLKGFHYIRTPYKTVDFDVYKVDWVQRKLMHMEDSLQGLAIFVGINDPLAVPVTEGDGLKPDSVYFTDENYLVEPTRLEKTAYGGHDNGIFDYRDKNVSACCNYYPIEYHKIRKMLPLPLWFTPN